MNGIALAHLIREKDQEMVLVFVTNYVQYAIKGYEVNAFDYLVKPVEYPSFRRKFDKVWHFLEGKSSDLVALHAGKSLMFVAASRIAWCEASRKGVNVHLVDGEARHSSDTMAYLEQALAAYRFLKPHRAFLVNPCHIEAIDGLTLRVNGSEIPISKHRKAEVYAALANFLGSELP